MDTQNQPTAAPTNKMAVSLLAGAAVTVIVWIISETAGVDFPEPVVGALVTLVSFALGWLIPNRVSTP